MSSLNKMQIIGRLGKDPEMRYLPSGEAVANFSVATSERWTDKASGEKKEQTEWHRCTAFGRTAEVIGQYVKKGHLIYIEGKLQTRKWTDKEKVERFTTEVRVGQVTMLEGKKDSSDSSTTPAKTAAPAARSFDDMDDDIPFANPYAGPIAYVS